MTDNPLLSFINILYIEDRQPDIIRVEKLLEEAEIANFSMTPVGSFQELKNYNLNLFDVVLISLDIPQYPGIAAITEFRKLNHPIPMVAITECDDEIRSIAVIQAGVQDCLIKGKFDKNLLVRALCFSMEREQAITMLMDIKFQQQQYFLTHDQLTGLPNKNYLLSFMTEILSDDKYKNNRFTILEFELQGLQQVNSTLGISFGDALLKIVSERLKKLYDNDVKIARFGGVQFVIILLKVIEKSEVIRFANNLLACLREPLEIHGEKILVTTNIGISIYPKDGHEAVDLIQKSMMAGKAARDIGRHNYCFYTVDIKNQAEEYRVLRHDLRNALENDELFLHYQPKIDLATGSIVGAEALLRWNHPTIGIISPKLFIPIAEAENLIVPIGQWVMTKCFELIRRWKADNLPFRLPAISLNVSSIQLEEIDFIAALRENLMVHGNNPDSIEFEITESILMKRPEQSIVLLNEIRHLGISISIDDFGTGYSSLTYLKRLPVDYIKIDQSFVKDVDVSSENAEIVRSTINMVHNLGLKVVAEGVEREEELQFLYENHCDYAQGYYFSKPVDEEKLLELVKNVNFNI